MTGLYIHIPFCRQKCRYCDFPSYGGVDNYIAPYVKALCREIADSDRDHPGSAGTALDTVYFGGGTPSLLSLSQVEEILTAVRHYFAVTGGAEITFEANPDSLTAAYAKGLAGLGINRLSIGIQSFQPGLLRTLGRIHTADEGKAAIWAAKNAGIDNLSADLMYGLPGQNLRDVDADLKELLALPLTHASIYSLILEEGTPFYHDVTTGTLELPPDDCVETMGQAVHAAMEVAGFEHYEISSYARPGNRSRHNTKYWQYVPYVSAGVTAHSFWHNCRQAHIANIPQYIRLAGQASLIGERVEIDAKRGPEDYCFLALRMRDGIDAKAFKDQFGTTVEAEFGTVLAPLVTQGLLQQTRRGYALTEKGLAYGNYVFSRFIR
ncbi:radical SAM family heme chaperone HemW [Megasphaera hominis]|uniref:Heme chaperone HemW n=1 Tax=Megasphaera hominis TaxID=159836 RepID=A0ABR6VH78_9FIRM|nr:radical SAM family heme chaperone HemW [Megasphaera hominis]MBC3536569.1 radical SAM family heme chaperone HemW [Megasphaera hominis]